MYQYVYYITRFKVDLESLTCDSLCDVTCEDLEALLDRKGVCHDWIVKPCGFVRACVITHLVGSLSQHQDVTTF